MALVSRMVRLFKADLHSILDQLEEPEAILNQAVREMEEEIASNEDQLEKLSVKINFLNKKKECWQLGLADLEKRIDICFQEQQDTLVKSLIKKKLETMRCLDIGEQKQQELIGRKKDLAAKLNGQKESLTTILDEKRLLAESYTDDSDKDQSWQWSEYRSDLSITEAEIDAVFLQEKSRRNQDLVETQKP